jgi:hypothetical protein
MSFSQLPSRAKAAREAPPEDSRPDGGTTDTPSPAGRTRPASGDPAAAWRAHAADLARWTLDRLVNRTDVWGGYYRDRDDAGNWVTCQTTHPRRAHRGKRFLTEAILTRHYRAFGTSDVAGAHSTSLENTSISGAVDIDRHGPTSCAPEVNLAAALHWYAVLRDLGFSPLLTDSNGKGGFHLRALFREPVPTPLVFAFLHWLIRDHAARGLPNPPETFPKQPRILPGRYGNWLRLLGRHHSRGYWSQVWDGANWLEGEAAVAFILSLRGDPLSLIPTGLPLVKPRPSAGVSHGTKAGRVRAGGGDTPDRIIGLIKEFIRKLPTGLGEGEHRDDHAYKFGAYLVRDLGLSDAEALRWLKEWDAGNRAQKGEDRLREIIANVHVYGTHPYGSGLRYAGQPAQRRVRRPRHLQFSFQVEVAE